MTATALPSVHPPLSANERFKGSFRSALWIGGVLAAFAHVVTFSVWPEYTPEDLSYVSEELTAIELPPEISIPAAPTRIPRPAAPIIAQVEIAEDITIAPTTFAMNPVEQFKLPPPPPELPVTESDLGAAPTFTPFTVAPSILNRDEVARAMAERYPPLLRSAGIGGTVRVYFFIDANGSVEDYRVHESSGHAQLDEAALAVAGLYRFSPALNRDRKVPVWVLFPIEFRVR